jgi:hypothetical protein
VGVLPVGLKLLDSDCHGFSPLNGRWPDKTVFV